jgi:hypothetical protein
MDKSRCRVAAHDGGSPQNRRVTWLSHKTKTGGSAAKTGSGCVEKLRCRRTLSGILPGYSCKEGRRRTPLRIYLKSYYDSFRVILLGLLPCNRLGTCPLDYIKEGRVPSRTSSIPPGTTPSAGRKILLQIGHRVATLATRNCINIVSCVLAHSFGFQIMAFPTFYLAAGTSYGGRQV